MNFSLLDSYLVTVLSIAYIYMVLLAIFVLVVITHVKLNN